MHLSASVGDYAHRGGQFVSWTSLCLGLEGHDVCTGIESGEEVE